MCDQGQGSRDPVRSNSTWEHEPLIFAYMVIIIYLVLQVHKKVIRKAPWDFIH